MNKAIFGHTDTAPLCKSKRNNYGSLKGLKCLHTKSMDTFLPFLVSKSKSFVGFHDTVWPNYLIYLLSHFQKTKTKQQKETESVQSSMCHLTCIQVDTKSVLDRQLNRHMTGSDPYESACLCWGQRQILWPRSPRPVAQKCDADTAFYRQDCCIRLLNKKFIPKFAKT